MSAGEGLIKAAVKAGMNEEAARGAVKEYDDRIQNAVINARRILDLCREKGFDVIHLKIQGPTANPRHTAKVNRKIGLIIPPEFEDQRFHRKKLPRCLRSL